MLVYFSGSARDIENDIGIYRDIVEAVHRAGGIMANNWIEVTAIWGGVHEKNEEWWDSMPGEAYKGIKDADALIVEASAQSSLGVGYELAQALLLAKPVLALVAERHKNNSYVQGIKHPLLKLKYYNPSSIKDIVGDTCADWATQPKG